MKKVIFSVFSLFMAVSLIGGLLVGCSKANTTTSTTTTTNALKQVVIQIGVTSPLTGGAAAYGLGQKHGIEMAFEDFNNNGGLVVGNTHYTFNVTSLDDAYDPTTATNNIRTLVYQDGVNFLFDFESASELALAPTLVQPKVIQFVVVDDDKILNTANTYTWRTHCPASMDLAPMNKYITTNYPNVKVMAHLAENNVTGTVTTTADVAAWQALGLTVSAQLFYDAGTTDFTPFLTKILSKNPDIINLSGTSEGEDALIVKQARALGYKGLFEQLAPVSVNDMNTIASNADLEGFLSTNVAMVAPLVSQQFIDLATREKAKYGVTYGVTWDFYSQALIMIEAMQKADSVDPETVNNILSDTTQVWAYPMFVGGKATFGSASAKALYGDSSLNYTHEITNSICIGVIHNGQDTNAAVENP